MSVVKASVLNHLGQPIGAPLPNWQSPALPARAPMTGHFCRLEPLDVAAHAQALYAANQMDTAGKMWTYLPYGPFADFASYRAWLDSMSPSTDPLFYTIINLPSGKPVGLAAYLRITPGSGTIEVGHLNYSPLLQQTPAATEAMYLMMAHVFSLGYRRYEWKCDSLNAPSRAAALRLGFKFEGIFRQATIVKGRTRDTSWYSIIDMEWPALREILERWLHPDNFDSQDHQRTRLSALTASATGQK
jgi:RimJ/RimL family protein N-acetyltransferase